MKRLNKELVEKLRNGDIVLENTGTVEELQEISNAAFPGGPVPTGRAKFYKKNPVFDWMFQINSPQLPTHPTSDFFIDEEPGKLNENKKNDTINHPAHYTTGNIEVIDFIEDKKLNYLRGNVIKYISRAGIKDKSKELEDLKKAAWYLNREIQKLEQNGNK